MNVSDLDSPLTERDTLMYFFEIIPGCVPGRPEEMRRRFGSTLTHIGNDPVMDYEPITNTLYVREMPDGGLYAFRCGFTVDRSRPVIFNATFPGADTYRWGHLALDILYFHPPGPVHENFNPSLDSTTLFKIPGHIQIMYRPETCSSVALFNEMNNLRRTEYLDRHMPKLEKAMAQYHAEHGRYPTVFDVLGDEYR